MDSPVWIFYLFGALAIAASFGVANAKNPLTGAICLLGSLLAVAGLFAWAGAHFLAAMQILVYAGAIAVLFVFVIMLLNLTDRELGVSDQLNGAHIAGMVLVLVMLVAASAVSLTSDLPFRNLPGDPGGVKNVGEKLLRLYTVPFEVISLLLLAAMAGAVMLTKRANGDEDAVTVIDRVRAAIDRRGRAGAFAPDPALPFQQGPPKTQSAPPADSPDLGVSRDGLDPGETV